jgi:hypothetical protein
MLNPLESRIPYLDRVKAQSEVLNCLRDELGQDRSNELVYSALRDWSRKVFEEVGSKKEGSGFEKWSHMSEELLPLIVDDIVEKPIRKKFLGVRIQYHRVQVCSIFQRNWRT